MESTTNYSHDGSWRMTLTAYKASWFIYRHLGVIARVEQREGRRWVSTPTRRLVLTPVFTGRINNAGELVDIPYPPITAEFEDEVEHKVWAWGSADLAYVAVRATSEAFLESGNIICPEVRIAM